MKRIKIKGVDEEYFYTKLKNGLEVYFMPDQKSKRFQISYVIKYGSYYNDFKVGNENKYYHLPNGVAHFLEHLLFKEKDGSEVTKKFAKYGSSADAFTSVNSTEYYVIGAKNFKANLNILLNFVNTPYFNKDNVSKEKGIIIEEIKMDEDDPYKDLYTKALKNIFYYSKLKESILGTVKEVKKITVDDINLAYHTFYQPKNMFIVITGNFNKEEALKEITNNESFKNFKKDQKITLKKIKEPLNVKKSYDEVFKNIEIPKTAIRIKLPHDNFKSVPKTKLKLCLNLVLEAKFGPTSKLNEALINQGLIVGSLYFGVSIGKDSILLSLFFESKSSKKVIKIIKEELKEITITKEELERKKRCIITNIILTYDDMLNKNYIISNNVINYGKVNNNQYEVVKKITVNDINNVSKKIFLDKNISIMIIKPMKKSTK